MLPTSKTETDIALGAQLEIKTPFLFLPYMVYFRFTFMLLEYQNSCAKGERKRVPVQCSRRGTRRSCDGGDLYLTIRENR